MKDVKVIKLDYRYRAYTQYAHTVGLRFPYFSDQVHKYTDVLLKTYPYTGFNYKINWAAYYGKKHRGISPYYITLRDEKMLSILLLTV